MSELADLAADVTKDMPAQVRKVIDAAIANGWELNKPGMTLALRLNHPTDELAMPVYISWTVGRTPKGALSFKFNSCATKGLNPLSGADLLEYLADPTVVYPAPEEPETTVDDTKDEPPWDTTRPILEYIQDSMGATPVSASPASSPSSGITVPKSVLKMVSGTQSAARSTTTAKPLRVTIPQVSGSAATRVK